MLPVSLPVPLLSAIGALLTATELEVVKDFFAITGGVGKLKDRLSRVPALRRFFSVVGSGLRLPVEVEEAEAAVGVASSLPNRADVERLASGLKCDPLELPVPLPVELLMLVTPALVPSTDETTD